MQTVILEPKLSYTAAKKKWLNKESNFTSNHGELEHAVPWAYGCEELRWCLVLHGMLGNLSRRRVVLSETGCSNRCG